MRIHSRKFRSGCRGFLMIEVMVTMVILAVGLLGAAALQARSMQYAYASAQRTIATIQANDLVERLWASACTLPGELETIEGLWQADWTESEKAEQIRLPGWSGVVEESGDNYLITIQWSDSRVGSSAAGEKQSFPYMASIPKLACKS